MKFRRLSGVEVNVDCILVRQRVDQVIGIGVLLYDVYDCIMKSR